MWGAALRPTEDCKDPIIVNIGNKISLNSAVEIVKKFCFYRVVEPIR